MDHFHWERSTVTDDPRENVEQLNEFLLSMINECFPVIMVRISTRDPPNMSPLVKHWCDLKNKNLRKYKQNENTVLQERINNLICAEQIPAVNERSRSYHTSSKIWWDTVNTVTGRKMCSAPVSNTIDLNTINSYFQSINTDDQYSTSEGLPYSYYQGAY